LFISARPISERLSSFAARQIHVVCFEFRTIDNRVNKDKSLTESLDELDFASSVIRLIVVKVIIILLKRNKVSIRYISIRRK